MFSTVLPSSRRVWHPTSMRLHHTRTEAAPRALHEMCCPSAVVVWVSTGTLTVEGNLKQRVIQSSQEISHLIITVTREL